MGHSISGGRMKQRAHLLGMAERVSGAVTRWAGSTNAFLSAVLVIVVWAALGPVFRYSDTWQLVINTGTTIVTFLMVFLIQRSQNKDALAIHLKLNELVAALEGASNRLIDVESLSERELLTLQKHFSTLAKLAGAQADVAQSHSVEEADRRHSFKAKSRQKR
jgi:low affinity Fe/Cu permease